jgi:D-arabinose 1-dehydrogenase-like Zn-dependent alcohol dehydrogenase
MKALILEGVQKLVLHDVPDPTPKENGAVVRVKANGICRSGKSHLCDSRLSPGLNSHS